MRLKALQDVAGLRIQQVYRAVGLSADARELPAIAVEADGFDDAVMRRGQNSERFIHQPPAEQLEPATAHEETPFRRERQVLRIRWGRWERARLFFQTPMKDAPIRAARSQLPGGSM